MDLARASQFGKHLRRECVLAGQGVAMQQCEVLAITELALNGVAALPS